FALQACPMPGGQRAVDRPRLRVKCEQTRQETLHGELLAAWQPLGWSSRVLVCFTCSWPFVRSIRRIAGSRKDRPTFCNDPKNSEHAGIGRTAGEAEAVVIGSLVAGRRRLKAIELGPGPLPGEETRQFPGAPKA